MKILFVSPVPTDPVGSGNRARIATLLRAAQACGHDVHFAHIQLEQGDVPAMRQRVGDSNFHSLPFKAQHAATPLRWARKFGRALKVDWAFMWGLDEWFDVSVLAPLRQLQQQHQFDAVCIEYVFMSKAFEAFPSNVVKLLDTHDRFGFRHRRYLAAGKVPQWFSTTDAEEVRGFLRADAVLAIQSSEAQDFRKRLAGHATTQVVEVSHFIESLHPVPPSTQPSAIFVGSDNPINTSAVESFIAHVLPRIRRVCAEFELRLAGSVGHTVRMQPGVVNLGFVDDLATAFASAAINVNPVHMGTGINIKLLDAMGFGMPCVTTETGARGLEQYAGDALWIVADHDHEAFASAVLGLLQDRGALMHRAQETFKAAERWNAKQFQNLQSVLLARQSPDRLNA